MLINNAKRNNRRTIKFEYEDDTANQFGNLIVIFLSA